MNKADNQTREDDALTIEQKALGEEIITLIDAAKNGLTYGLIGQKSCEEGMAILSERIKRLLSTDARINSIDDVKITCESFKQEVSFIVESICGAFRIQYVLWGH